MPNYQSIPLSFVTLIEFSTLLKLYKIFIIMYSLVFLIFYEKLKRDARTIPSLKSKIF